MEVMERTTNQTMRQISTDKPCVIFDKDYDMTVASWDRTDEGALSKINYSGPRFSVPLFPMPEIEQKYFEKFFPGHNKVVITEGVNKDFVGYYKAISNEVKYNGT
jgi:hypothetical protein